MKFSKYRGHRHGALYLAKKLGEEQVVLNKSFIINYKLVPTTLHYHNNTCRHNQFHSTVSFLFPYMLKFRAQVVWKKNENNKGVNWLKFWRTKYVIKIKKINKSEATEIIEILN